MSEARELRVPALRRSPGAGRHDGAAACAPCAWSPEPSLGGTGSARNTSTQKSKITKQKSNINELQGLNLDMRKISNDMEEMCGILDLYMYEDLNYRMNTEFNIIKSQHEKTMLDMNKMIQSIIGSMQYSKELIEDNYSYSIKEDHLLHECTQLNKKVRILLNENRRLLVEQAGHKCPVGKKRGSLMRPARTSVSQVPRNSSVK
ncbi:alpha-takusan-like protein [Mus musculus]|nr:alpha-takusan-like protein [Mus musculus]